MSYHLLTVKLRLLFLIFCTHLNYFGDENFYIFRREWTLIVNLLMYNTGKKHKRYLRECFVEIFISSV